MFEVRKPAEDAGLKIAIDNVYSEMAGSDSHTTEYAKSVDQLVKLYALKEPPRRISPDTLAIVLGNILGIILIVGHERTHIVTSKALQLLPWTRSR